MKPQRITSPIVHIILALLCVMWSMAGWFTFLSGSFTTSSKRSAHSTTVDGMGAEFLGVVFIVLGLLGVALFMRNIAVPTPAKVLLGVALAVVPPLVVRVWLAAG